MTARSFVPRTVGTGLAASGIALLLSAFVAPLGLAGVLGVGATFLVIGVHGVRRHGTRRRATAGIAASLVLWVAASVSAWMLWGVGFDLADAGRPVPGAVTAATFGSAVLALVAFVVMIGTGMAITVKLWRRCAHAGIASVGTADAAR
ncbi:MAG: hypothetical protein HY996_07330 [Micrococcales bacterium]|nr:hypothetical protein [Micrococcales bacterium]